MIRNAVSRSGMQAVAGLVIAALLLLLSGCNMREAEPSFHPLPELAYVKTSDYNGEARSIRYEYIVIAHPPADREKLQALVDAYNEKTLTAEQLSRHYAYVRRFYKESENMPRDYKESHKSYFDIDRIEYHGDDLAVVVQWEEFGKEHNYEFF